MKNNDEAFDNNVAGQYTTDVIQHYAWKIRDNDVENTTMYNQLITREILTINCSLNGWIKCFNFQAWYEWACYVQEVITKEKGMLKTIEGMIAKEYIQNYDNITKTLFKEVNNYVINYNWDEDINDIAGDFVLGLYEGEDRVRSPSPDMEIVDSDA